MSTPESLFPRGFEDSRCLGCIQIKMQGCSDISPNKCVLVFKIKRKVVRSFSKELCAFHCLHPIIQLLADFDKNRPTCYCPAGLVATPVLLFRISSLRKPPQVSNLPSRMVTMISKNPKTVEHRVFNNQKTSVCVRGNMAETPG